ncbi:MAG: CDP-glucose 4,6-dehydratase [Alphaproteobacteria bacterium]
MASLVDNTFWRGRRVLLTGHTGFKGSWAALWLCSMGADVRGLSLAPDTTPSLFELARVDRDVEGGLCDLRDSEAVVAAVRQAKPQIVLHMAAQPLVRRSMKFPVDTFSVNVMGTAYLLEALRDEPDLQAVVVVTTDKVYENPETGIRFAEGAPLGGHDPYSASKAAAEILVASYERTYFRERGIPVATARGGNVIGGGDFSEDRIVPDVFRAMQVGQPIMLRNPGATRPWQHVLDCLTGYLAFTQALVTVPNTPRAMNFGPLLSDDVPVKDLAEAMQRALGARHGWIAAEGPQPREMKALSLDCSLASEWLGFRDRLSGLEAIRATAEWYLSFARGEDMRARTLNEIRAHHAA